jgi:hypothetical protein
MAQIPNGIEHRWGERVRVDIPVHVTAPSSAAVDGHMKNLSLSGALMKADCDLRLHLLIDVHIEVPAPSPRTGVVKAYVSRKLPEGVGIEWCQFAPPIVKDLLRSPSIRFPP